MTWTAPVQAQFYKTKMCPLFEKGRCFNGRKCRYAHSDSELRELPDLRCTKLCESVLKGEPCKSDNCTFAHTREELRTSHITFHKVSLCNFYKKGRCLNGVYCRFAHGLSELRGPLPKKTSNPKSKKGGLKGRRRMDDGEYSEYTDDHNMGMEVHDIRSPHSVTTLTGGISPTPPSSGPGISVASTTCSISDNDNSTENRAFHGGFPRHVLEGVAEGDSTDGSSHEGHSVVGVPPGAYIKKFDVERSITEVTATPLPPTPTPSLVFISRQAEHAHHEMSASPPVATPQAAPATPHSFKPPLPPMCSVPLPTHDLTSLATHRPSSKKKKPLTMPLPLPLSSLLGPYGGEGILGGGPTDKADVVVGVGAKAAPERSSSGPVVTRQASFPLETVARSVTGSSLSTVRPPPLDIPHSASVGSVGGKVVSGYPPHSHSRPSHSSSTSMPSGDTPVGSGGGSGMGGFYTPGVGPTTPALSASSTTTPLPNFHHLLSCTSRQFSAEELQTLLTAPSAVYED